MASQKRVNLLLDCFICGRSRLGQDPRQLDCKHCFCYQCLTTSTSHVTKDHVQCPACLKFTGLSHRGIAGLPGDGQVEKAAEVIALNERSYMCMTCQARGNVIQAASRCRNCDRKLCSECVKKHVSRFSSHVIMTDLCHLHISEYTSACLTCQSRLCLDCIESELHDGHDVCDVTEVAAKVGDVLTTGKEIIQHKMNELDKLITMTSEKAQGRLNKRRGDTERKLELNRKQLFQALETCLNKRDEHYHEVVDSALGKQKHAFSEASRIINEIERLTQETDMTTISNLSTKTLDLYKAMNVLTSALSSPVALPDLGSDHCGITELSETGYFEFKSNIGQVIFGCTVDLKSKPKKLRKISTIDGKGINYPYWIKAAPDSTLIVGEYASTQARRINMSGELKAKYTMFAESGKVRGIAVSNNTVYVLSQSGATVTAHTGGPIHIINLEPQVQDPWGMDTDGESLLIVQHNKKLLRYSYQGELLQQFESSNIHNVTCAEHPDVGPVYLVTDRSDKLVHGIRLDGARIRSFGDQGEDDGQFIYPHDTAMLPNGNIIVADYNLDRVSEFTFEGVFIRHLLTRKDGLAWPLSLCVSLPYLWVGCYGAVYLYSFASQGGLSG